ncbi:cardiolipin synthase [Agromyces atrinae]|uniref:Cardiolipin synthase n=1 Tax=Agromyces atrinae TaxID=592376 RepID=A0A4Q2M5F1_9MICO|nr:cardiolipin synthase [Agromyces atrinae]MCI2956128.1 cardiolipin synthase [Agromyces atrinae]NYD68460.1 cardiolipin synthase [Agromyces atrinae]RXZ84992.1 cardiolipin synthase [Agromyces atrinae]
MPSGEQTALILGGVLIAIDLIVRVVAVIVVPRNRRPTAGMAWLLAIFFIPFLGVFFFLLIGSPKLGKHRSEQQAEVNQFILDTTDGVEHVSSEELWPDWFEGIVRQNRNLGAMPLIGGNGASLIGDYQASLDAMTAAVDDATNYVHVEFYILALDQTTAPFFDALERAVKRGVTVRVLLDHIASLRSKGYRKTLKRLTNMGAEWHLMLPVQPFKGKYQRPDLRNHRKLLVVDGEVAYMGSLNMIDRSYNKPSNIRRGLQWQELIVRLEGPIVSGINAIFLTDWYLETDELLQRSPVPFDQPAEAQNLDCQVVPSGPGFPNQNNLKLFLALMYAAQEKIIITSPYFVPDEAMLLAISGATQRGIHVELFVSEIGDQALVYHAQRSYYEALLRAGVRIYMYPGPYILHAKHFSIDDDVAVIGSSNMDIRSFELNMEVSLLVRGATFVADMRRVEDGYRAISTELTLESWLKQPLRSTVLDNLARLTSALQ